MKTPQIAALPGFSPLGMTETAPVEVTYSSEVTTRIKAIRGMAFQTAGFKARLLRTLNNVKRYGYWKDAKGAWNYRVKGPDGLWHAETSPGFQAAVAYQKLKVARYRRAA